ncbi:efflux transporter outer membrane subunit [Pseudomonas brassicacearum]|uniref:efflux transporter outer membrane subunit n=1 Tax=Pseudomonas brassicacearum TaxID=930166 RepID=UPI00025FE8D6|nr:efflux transporter outer membrane subunit [Pseudomonas brassicacearum]EIK66270.1 outer membrane efflux protein OprM [Pseudomonas fluorescens Q8r1-96]KAB0524388.1 efflux transporter outer membrane subunit [Pseudomonas brassicacearum subsp. brassicacearum]NJP62713.1 efflux transporter outer membrane subunit [Pseudomonas brassicacearum]QEO79648.1 efflux transporter outer membrane subunit [Pseudomonas brassicacearum]SDP68215.1 outer membrane protein, multidrug efflux system [Pseudomonas brassic
MIKFRWPLLAILTLLGGCMNLAPQYERPEAPVAEQWLPAASTPKGQVSADIEWQSFFTDSRLARLQSLALSNNRDLRLAVLNVEKAQAQYRIQRAESLPSIDASVSGTHSRTPGLLSNTGSAATTHDYSAQLGLSSYEVDLFGRVQNLQDEALEDYLALTETRRSTQISLVAEVATAWLTLAADNERLHLAQETLRSQQATYELTQRSHALGGSSGLSVAQAQTTVESARVDAAAYESQILQDRNALRLLVGSDIPEELLPGAYLESAAALVQVPAELPSSLLQRRPDVLAAEHTLKSANIDIGAARAAFFPSISLTANAGSSSSALSGLFKSGSGAWTFAPSISLPIFDAGSNRATLDSAKTEREIQVQTYQQTLQSAFKEVADALAERSTLDRRIEAQQALTDASRKSFELSDALYRGGSQSYLEALDAQRSLYSAQQDLITLRLTEQSNRVTLYKVMGGGWN